MTNEELDAIEARMNDMQFDPDDAVALLAEVRRARGVADARLAVMDSALASVRLLVEEVRKLQKWQREMRDALPVEHAHACDMHNDAVDRHECVCGRAELDDLLPIEAALREVET